MASMELRLMNLKLRPGKKESIKNNRRAANIIITSKNPDLLFLQISEPGSELEKLKLQDRYTYRYQTLDIKALGLMWRSDSFIEVKKWTMSEKVAALSDPDMSKCLPTRTCVVLLEHKSSKKFLLVICWHGPKKITIEERAFVFTGLLQFARNIQQTCMPIIDQLPPIVVGGSFNLQLGSAELLGSEFAFGPCLSSIWRRGENYYFLSSLEVTVIHVRALEFNKKSPIYCHLLEDMNQDQLYPLDHDPLKGRLVFKQVKSGQGARAMTSGNDKPPTDKDRFDRSGKPDDLDKMMDDLEKEVDKLYVNKVHVKEEQ